MLLFKNVENMIKLVGMFHMILMNQIFVLYANS